MREEYDHGHDIFKIDIRNAFNEINIGSILSALKSNEKLHFLIPHFRFLYEKDTSFLFKKGEHRATLSRSRGVIQGHCLSSALFCLGINETLLRVQSGFRARDVSVMSYADDIFVSGPVGHIVQAAGDLIRGLGSECQLSVSRDKMTILIDEDNYPGVSLDAEDALREEGLTCKIVDTGLEACGVPIGKADFVSTFCSKNVESYQSLYERLRFVKSNQVRLALLSRCFAHKMSFLMKCLPSAEIMDALESHMLLIKLCLTEVFANGDADYVLPESVWNQEFLPTYEGGLGILNVVELAPMYYVGSVANAVRVRDGLRGVAVYPPALDRLFKDFHVRPELPDDGVVTYQMSQFACLLLST